MYTEIITNKAVVVNALFPTELYKVLFKDFQTVYNPVDQSESFAMNIYKVIEVEGEEDTYEELQYSARNMDKATLDALVASLNITSTTYTDIRNEQITKGLAKVIETEGIFGLTETDLILR
jgi:hypothetical protein